MKLSNKLLLAITAVAIITSCSKLEDSITPAPQVGTHNAGNLDPASPNFHGLIVSQSVNGWSECRQCHADDLSGGIAQVGCNAADCHPTFDVHVEGILDPASQAFHGNFLRMNNWNLLDCKKCHGDDYAGGIASPTCVTCHTHPSGPEACNTCHGDFDDPQIIAPPQDTNNNTETDFAGVGAHKVHLYNNDIARTIECTTCHIVPDNFSSDGHIDQTPRAEVIFGDLAINNIAIDPAYDYSNVTCTNTYCHGNFEYLKDNAPELHKPYYEEGFDRMMGNNIAVIWNNVDGTQAECGSCHNLPPIGHVEANLSGCGTCHSGIFDRDGNIVDSLSYKHINGVVDVTF